MTHKKRLTIWLTVTICLVVVLVVSGLVYRQITLSKIDNFQACQDAGGVVMETYPEQCRINNQTFVNQNTPAGNTDGYVGLTEQSALDKTEREGVKARVIERDGQALPATMDFQPGRHNLSVKDGKVYKVDIEG